MRTAVVRLAVAGAALLAAVASARAQEDENPHTPGAIPNPGTYQGSQQLQHQQDYQDQQFRQQQQQQYQPGSRGGPAYGGGSSAGPDCHTRIAGLRDLAPLRAVVSLGHDDQDPARFTIPRKATAAERPLLARWIVARRYCNAEVERSDPNPAHRAINIRGGEIAIELIEELANGRLTYGQFNYRRAMNSANMERAFAQASGR